MATLEIQTKPAIADAPTNLPHGSPKAKGEIMVQVFMVLRCYSCQTFQVHQVKKSNKWNCKVCNEKQSVIKTYGKGTAADCRRHVQKLNMMRAEKEQLENEQLRSSPGSHPPEDYADTFTAQVKPSEEIPHHPVVLAGRSAGKSKWTSFIEPEDEDEEGEDGDGAFTTDKEEFARAQKPRKQVKRSASDRGPHPLSSRTNLPTSSALSSSNEKVYPYSCVSREMEDKLDDHTDKLTNSRSTYDSPVSDRYRKLEDDSFVYSTGDVATSANLSGSAGNIMTGTSPSSPSNHKDSMAKIREDISRYKCENPPQAKARDEGGHGGNTKSTTEELPKKETVIPKVSSKWTQFMCEDDSEGEEGDNEEEQLLTGLGSAGVVASGYTVAHFTAPTATKQT